MLQKYWNVCNSSSSSITSPSTTTIFLPHFGQSPLTGSSHSCESPATIHHQLPPLSNSLIKSLSINLSSFSDLTIAQTVSHYSRVYHHFRMSQLSSPLVPSHPMSLYHAIIPPLNRASKPPFFRGPPHQRHHYSSLTAIKHTSQFEGGRIFATVATAC